MDVRPKKRSRVMNLTSNSSGGGSGKKKSWIPGIRFYPSDVELVLDHLKRKICRELPEPEIIGETNVFKWEPEELPGQSLWKSGDRQWFFFCPIDRNYPNGARLKRATRHGYWKITGQDRDITCNSRTVGVIKTLVYYKGRALTGERTNWVMHEYTMDKEELKRYQTGQDNYAIYKFFKKSGAGPKNGEQYWAPSREEEWADDDCFDQCQLTDDLGEVLRHIIDESEVILSHNDEFANPQHQVGGEEEAQSTMVELSLGEAISVEPSIVLPPCEQTSFGLAHSPISNLQSCEVPEATSAPNIHEKEPHGALEDFLEMDDLIPNSGNYGGNWQIGERDGFGDPDLFFDTDMFLCDIGRADCYQLLSQPDDADHPSSPLWEHDQRYNVCVSTESSQVVLTPSVSGLVVNTNVPDPLNEEK